MSVSNVHSDEVYDASWGLGLLNSLSITCFLAMHWAFTSHYLRMASFLTLKNDQHGGYLVDTSFVNRANTVILVLDVFVYAVLVTVLIISIVYESLGLNLMAWLLVILFWLITIINYFSMRQITRSTQLLNMPGIIANMSLRNGFASFFLCAAICNLVSFSMQRFADGSEPETTLYYRFVITSLAFDSATEVMVMGAHSFMLIMYVKYSQKLRLTEQDQNRLAQSLSSGGSFI